MARRSSARLRGHEPSTPKRVSLSHDAPTRTPRTAPVKMPALDENDEMPGAFPQSASPPSRFTVEAERAPATSTSKLGDSTPKNTTPLKPASEEMHPAQHHQSTAKPFEEARWLGFSSMAPHTEPSKSSSQTWPAQHTPTKAQSNNEVGTPKYQFTFKREHSLELSPAAKQLMEEKRGEAAKIREQMLASGEGVHDVAAALGRRIATPRGKKGRFSEAHTEAFNKMDSIANHPSAFRATPKIDPPASTAIRVQTEGQRGQHQHHTPSPAKSLKRSTSKAELDSSPHTQQSGLPRSSSKPIFGHAQPQSSSQLPRSTYQKATHTPHDAEPSSPAKRMKRSAGEDVSVAVPSLGGPDKRLPTTPASKRHIGPLNVSTLASPTEASLSRASSIKATDASKIPAPALVRSPSKPAMHTAAQQSGPSTPLLARSPSKASLFPSQDVKKAGEEVKAPTSPLLLRSPLKVSIMKPAGVPKTQKTAQPALGALLSRSPLKVSVAKGTKAEASQNVPAPSTPLLARSPMKVALPDTEMEDPSAKTPNKSSGANLLGRFNLLRASPMKSILRSPQRLYSDDPAKVAAGTHLATPPKHAAAKSKLSTTVGSMTAPVAKHVDFSSSTKDRYERAHSELNSTPSKASTPSAKGDVPKDSIAQYPTLPQVSASSSTPPNRRQTVAPANFTFRAGEHNIVFAQSPNALLSPSGSKRPATIRHVSAEPELPSAPLLVPASTTKKRKFEFENQATSVPVQPQADPQPLLVPSTTTKKRKFDFENGTAADQSTTEAASDKENTAEAGPERPTKRVKVHPKSPPKQATRRPTLGVRPKKGDQDSKGKKESSISRARLNALAQPKRRA